jgi:hypothetical protein
MKGTTQFYGSGLKEDNNVFIEQHLRGEWYE